MCFILNGKIAKECRKKHTNTTIDPTSSYTQKIFTYVAVLTKDFVIYHTHDPRNQHRILINEWKNKNMER